MTQRSWSGVIAGAGLALLLAGGAHAYPVPRAGHEKLVSPAEPIVSIGQWLLEDGQLGLAQTKRSRNVRIVDAKSGSFARARLTNATGSWTAILFRVRPVSDRPLQLRGYGFVVNTRKGQVEILRFDEGGVRNPGVAHRNPLLSERPDLEVCLWMAGSSFVGVVYDGISKEVLATLAWSDPSYTDGYLGVHLGGKGGEAVRIGLWVATQEAGKSRPWVADDWLVVLDPSTASTLPEGLGALLKPSRATQPGQAAFITTEAAVASLRQHAVPMRAAQPGVPFKYRDHGYFERATLIAEKMPSDLSFVEGLKDPHMVEAHLRAFAERFPQHTRFEVLGRSVQGRPITALRIADDPDDTTRPTFLFCGAHHANEAITPELPLDMARYVLEHRRDKQVERWLERLTVVVVPLVNPDGSHAFWHESDQLGRKNRRLTVDEEPHASGVDLNRNYPFRWGDVDTRYNTDVPTSNFYRGPSPASEPEVMAMMRLASREHFLASISYHAAATKLLVPYTSGEQRDPSPSAAWAVAEEMIVKLKTHRFRGKRYEMVRSLYEVNGTDQDWLYHSFGTTAYLVEAPFSVPTRPANLREAVVHSRHAWRYLLERWLAGPSLSVRTKDKATGTPIEAEVTLDEVKLSAGEKWRSRRDNGWFHQYLPAPGSYTVRARAGKKTAMHAFEIERGVLAVELEL